MNKKLLTILTVVLVSMMALLTACSSPQSDPESVAAPAAATAEEDTATDGSEDDADDADETVVSSERTFVVVPADSTASYIVNEEFLADALSKLGIEAGESVVTGSTNDVEGSLTIDLENRTLGEAAIAVNLTSLTTDQSRRDNWVQDHGPQFSKFPTANFVATEITGAPESYTEGSEASFQLLGDLTVREVTIPVVFDVTAAVEGDTLTGVAEANLNISDFGIDPPAFARTLKVEDPFVIRVEMTAIAE